MRGHRCVRPPTSSSTPANSLRARWPAPRSPALPGSAASTVTASPSTGSHASHSRPRSCWCRCRQPRQSAPRRPSLRLRHRVCLGAAHRRRTLASPQHLRPPCCPRRLPVVQLHAAIPERCTSACIDARASARADDGASATADVVRQFSSARRSARPVRVLRVSAVADGDERHDASPDISAAAPERRVVTAFDTRDDNGDRPAAPIMIASLCSSTRLSSGKPSSARRARSTACGRQSSPPRSSGWALTVPLASLKSRLYGGAA